MYTDLIFVCYITAICLSLLCLALIALVLVHKDYRDNKAFVTARNFAGTITLTGLLYFVFYYREMVRDQYELFLPFRIADYVLCCVLILFWLVLVFYLMDQEAYEKLLLFAKIFTGVRLAASLLITAGFMGPYYDINAPVARGVWTVLEALFTVVTVLLLVAFALMGLKECVSRLRRSYILVCSLLLGAWSIIQCVVDAGLFFGKYGMSAWLEECPDLTGLILFLCSLSTFLFVFKEDFSPLFFADSGRMEAERDGDEIAGPAAAGGGCPEEEEKAAEDGQVRSEQELAAAAGSQEQELARRIDRIAEIHKLTVREKEVLELVYDGYTNPDIAEALFISINTVKKHIRNIYEKLGVNSRMETVHLVNARNRWK